MGPAQTPWPPQTTNPPPPCDAERSTLMPCFSSRSPIHQTLHCRRTLHVLPRIRSQKRPQDAALIDIVLDFIMISLQYQLSERNMPARTTQSAASERIASTMSGWGMLILNIAFLFCGFYLHAL